MKHCNLFVTLMFHRQGNEIITALLNKGYIVGHFTKKAFEAIPGSPSALLALTLAHDTYTLSESHNNVIEILKSIKHYSAIVAEGANYIGWVHSNIRLPTTKRTKSTAKLTLLKPLLPGPYGKKGE
jgi:hypothetical protein